MARGPWTANCAQWAEGVGEVEKERAMVATDRKLLRKKLDKEMRFYRLAGREQNPTNGLLRAVREALRIPFREMTESIGVERSGLIGLEERERTGSITLRSLGRMAEAMGCKVVYGVVPLDGKTLEELAEERLWREVLGGQGPSEQGNKGPRERGNEKTRDQATKGTSEREIEADQQLCEAGKQAA